MNKDTMILYLYGKAYSDYILKMTSMFNDTTMQMRAKKHAQNVIDAVVDASEQWQNDI